MFNLKREEYKVDFLVGGAASIGACLFSNPIEVVKTRLQLQGELVKRGEAKIVYKNFVQAFYLIIKNEGVKGILKGLGPACFYQMTMNSIRLGSYNRLHKSIKSVMGRDNEFTSIASRLSAGALAGYVGSVTASPFYLVKTRMQSSSSVVAIGTQYHYSNTFQALKSIYKEGGIAGLYRGAKIAGIRVAMGSAVQLTSYDFTKEYLLQLKYFEKNQGLVLHFTSAMVSGVLVTTAMNPADVMTTRMYNQPVVNGKGVFYSSILDCIVKIFKSEGFFGFYKGWTAHCARVGPHTILTFVFLEQLKNFVYRY